jgi:DNA-binding LacI/PurR family transcriptional regulator
MVRPVPRAGIQEVADRAGVSITTVSHALSGKGRIAAGTRERIRRIAEELQYRPHAGARSLAAGKSGLLGLALSPASTPSVSLTSLSYFIGLMTAASSEAIASSYALVLLPKPTDAGDPFDDLDLDGAIIVDPAPSDPYLARLRSRGIPVVTTGRDTDDPHADHRVDNDHFAATLSMLRHLERARARRVALATAQPTASYVRDIISAYEQWSEQHGSEPLVVESDSGDLSESAGFAAGVALLDRPSPPDAIYATADRVALGVLLAARTRGIGIPDRVMLAAGSDSDASRHTEPSLTALSLNEAEVGRRALKMLVELVDGREPAETRVTVPVRIRVRASTRRASAG